MRTWLRALRTGIVCLGVASLASCHTYRVVESPPVGSVVRVRVPVTSALVNRNAPPQTASIEGLLLAAGDTLTLASERRVQLSAYRELVQRDTFRLATSQASSIEVKELSASRSILLGTVIAAGAAAGAAFGFGLGGGAGGTPGPGDGIQTSVVVAQAVFAALRSLVAR